MNSGKFTMTWKPQMAQVAASGDMGWTWGLYTMAWIDENGEEKQGNGKYLNVWRMTVNGKWRVVADMGN
jgi:ketosteroid isomerase-like protein